MCSLSLRGSVANPMLLRVSVAPWLVLSVCSVLSVVAPAQQLSADDEKALLAKLRERRAQFPALTADFTEERTTHLLNKPIRGSGTIAFHAPGKFRRRR